MDNGSEHPPEMDLLPWRQPEAGKHLLQRLGKAGGGIIQYAGLARGGIHHQPVQLLVLLRKAPVGPGQGPYGLPTGFPRDGPQLTVLLHPQGIAAYLGQRVSMFSM